MPATNLITTGTSAVTSSDVVIADGSWATLVMTGAGKAFVEVKTIGDDYIPDGELTTKAPVLKLQGPMTVRVRRELVAPTWVPSGMAEVTYPLGVDLYLDTSNLSAIATGIGAPADAAASTDTGSFSLLSFVKRGLQNWATLLSRIPALVGGALPTTDTQGGTRAFNWAAGTRVAFPTTSTGALPLPTLGASRELQVLPDARCFIRFGDSGVAAATVAEGQMIALADIPNVIRVPVGQTHYRVIGQFSSGNLSLTPVL